VDVAERGYLSIGEVLALLKEEFPDITISKIRFLESQGLLDPERTPSGYRKFYEDDVERLRWILRQQREHFLPLKVIKGRLKVETSPGDATDDDEDDDEPQAADEATTATPARHADVAALIEPPKGAPAAASSPSPSPASSAASAGSTAPSAGPTGRVLTGAQTGASLTLDELCGATELAAADIAELEKFGLVSGRPVAGVVYYDEDALLVARLAAQFRRFGVQARHLRMYRTAAEREAGFAEQVVLPLLKQRNPEARRQAVETLEDLARLGQNLRGAMLRQLLRQYLEGPS
jgi:DNA-binding transcriptional MerR regulator